LSCLSDDESPTMAQYSEPSSSFQTVEQLKLGSRLLVMNAKSKKHDSRDTTREDCNCCEFCQCAVCLNCEAGTATAVIHYSNPEDINNPLYLQFSKFTSHYISFQPHPPSYPPRIESFN